MIQAPLCPRLCSHRWTGCTFDFCCSVLTSSHEIRADHSQMHRQFTSVFSRWKIFVVHGLITFAALRFRWSWAEWELRRSLWICVLLHECIWLISRGCSEETNLQGYIYQALIVCLTLYQALRKVWWIPRRMHMKLFSWYSQIPSLVWSCFSSFKQEEDH